MHFKFDPDKEFFIIDSFNASSVETHLYGYCINGTSIIENSDMSGSHIELSGEGSYIFVERSEKMLRIFQDNLGSYGIYLYQYADYYAISNSYVYLFDYLKDKVPLSFNKSYAEYFAISDLCSLIPNHTLINEIIMLDRRVEVHINLETNKLDIHTKKNEEATIEMASVRGLNILDKWYSKWISFIRSLFDNHSNIEVDLTGGFDSRVVLALIIGSGIDLTKVCFNTSTDGLSVHNEDYKIAKEMADHFGFKLNNRNGVSVKKATLDVKDALLMSVYSKFGFHKQLYYPLSYSNMRLFRFTGEAGEIIRDYCLDGIEEEESLIASQLKRIPPLSNKKYENQYKDDVRSELNYSYSHLKQLCGGRCNESSLLRALYLETRARNHYGRSSVERYFSNRISVRPQIDPLLWKIKPSRYLPALIFYRYCPDLCKFDIEGGRTLTSEDIAHVKKISDKCPVNITLTKSNFQLGVGCNQNYDCGESSLSRVAIDGLLLKSFLQTRVRLSLLSVLDREIYDEAELRLHRTRFFPLSGVYALLPIYHAITYTNCSKVLLSKYSDLLDAPLLIDGASDDIRKHGDHNSAVFGLYSPLFETDIIKKYTTLRIDIQGKKDISLLNEFISDNNYKISRPDWMNNNGLSGTMITSYNGYIRIHYDVSTASPYRVYLRTLDLHDYRGEKNIILLDVTKLMVNGQDMITELKTIDHDHPIKIEFKGTKNSSLDIYVEWIPHDIRVARNQ